MNSLTLFGALIHRAVILLLLFFCGQLAYADDTGLNGFNSLGLRPVTSNGLYGVAASTIIARRTYTFGLLWNLARHVTNVMVPARAATIDLTSTQLIGDLHAGLGLLSWLDVGIDLPFVLYQRGTNFTSLQSYQTAALGDMRFDTKVRLLKDQPKSIGVAFLSSATFPTGSRMKFTGDDGLTWEGRLILDKSFHLLSLYANAGYRFVKAVNVLATTRDDRITFGGGLRVPLVRSGDWALVTEVVGETGATDHSRVATPIEVRGGLRKIFASGLVLDLGGGAGLTKAYGNPDYRIIAGLSFNLAKRQEAGARRMVTEAPAPIHYTVYFGFGRATVRQKDYDQLRSIGQILAGNPVRTVVVSGFTDHIGPRRYNRFLSRRRAEVVQQYLGYFGAAPAQITVQGLGKVLPPPGARDPATIRQNRRVDIRE